MCDVIYRVCDVIIPGNRIPVIVRFHPLWLNQASFTENADKFYYHELYIYFLTDASGTVLYKKKEQIRLE